jgi:predicted dithiol-disulfide oxidoreductase (DUF899 family)
VAEGARRDAGQGPHSGCPGCSFFTDHVPNLAHVNARDTTFVLASPADQDKIAALKQRMDWHAPWYIGGGGCTTSRREDPPSTRDTP